MTPSFTPAELDALLRAAVEFEDQFGPQFFAGNLGGRAGVTSDSAMVKRMAEWLAETDRGLLENLGIASDNITYFRLGRQARTVLAEGGMDGYFARRRRAERLEKARTWLPIGISAIAIIFTALTYFGVKPADKRIDMLESQVAALQADAAANARALATARGRLDTLATKLEPHR